MDLTCPQCNNIIKDSSSRLVQDSCGHKKCRGCLLNDEHECKLCAVQSEEENNLSIDEKIQLQKNLDELTLIAETSDQNENDCIELRNVLYEDLKPEVCLDTKTNILKRPYSTCLLPSHINLDEHTNKYTCTICSRSFVSKGYIKYHKYCVDGGKRPYQCKYCPKSFINLSQLDIHELIHTNKKPFSCDICKKLFRQRSKLTRHRHLHNDWKLYKCESCDKAYKTKESLTSHIATHVIDKPFICSICTASFNNSSNYRKHLTIHTKEKPHMCDLCGKRFKLKWTLNIHKKIHLSDKPYRCSHCAKVFSYAKDLHRHELIHMDTKAYACGSCNVEFRRKDNLERHMRNLHPGKNILPIKKEIPTQSSSKNNQNSIIEKSQSTKVLPSEVPCINHFLLKPTDICQKDINIPILTHDIPDNTPLLQRLDVVRDRPNAVTVIRAPPAKLAKNRENREEIVNEPREEKSVINAPLKLALKTNEFKSHYNIQSRNCLENEEENANNQRSVLPSEISKIDERKASLTSFTAPKASGIHYETSFEQEKHAIIKNIKFKLPAKYTNLKSKPNNITLNNFSNNSMQLQNYNFIAEANSVQNIEYLENNLIGAQNIEICSEMTAGTSVIVNTSYTADTPENVHWRRRMARNLNTKLLD